MLETLELLEVLTDELLSGVDTLELLSLLTGISEPSGLLSELEASELCTELSDEELPEALEMFEVLDVPDVLDVLELCVEEDVPLTSTLITVPAPEVSPVLLQPVKFAHIIRSDRAAAKNSDFLFISYHSITV